MSERAKNLSRRIEAFRDDVIAYVEALSDEDWGRTCEWEEWPVGVTAHHIGAGHFAIFDFLGMIVRGEQLPQLTMDEINEMSKQMARKNAGCTRTETLERLRENGAGLADYVASLDEEELDRKGGMPRCFRRTVRRICHLPVGG